MPPSLPDLVVDEDVFDKRPNRNSISNLSNWANCLGWCEASQLRTAAGSEVDRPTSPVPAVDDAAVGDDLILSLLIGCRL